MGESLQEKINLAMSDSVLDMRFTHYLGEFVDDEGFLEATSQAALQVEMKKALKASRDAVHAAPVPTTKKKERKKEEKRPTARTEGREPRKNDP